MSRKEERGGKASKGMESGAAVAGIALAAGAVNAIPIAGQVAAAALGLAAMFTKIFAGRKQRKRNEANAKRKVQIQQQANYRQALSAFSPNPQGQDMLQGMNFPGQSSQGYGMFQQMQEESVPVYTSGQGTSYGG